MASIEVEGEDQLVADLGQLGEDLNAIPTMEEISIQYASIASSFAPKDTGKLAGSIRPTTNKNKAGAIATAPYAHIINYGSPRLGIPASRFMNRADSVMEGKIPDILDRGIEKLIDARGLGE